MATIIAPYYPVIFVRGYAGNDDEIDDAISDPYMGFNLGATKFRQKWTGAVHRHYFESPLYRLAKDYGYTDVYSNGQNMPSDVEVPPKSVVIYRYYDEQYFEDLSKPGDISAINGRRREIEQFADGLGKLILRLRDRICGQDAGAREKFRVYLVAHSMGGLVCRCLLQNPKVGDAEAKALVDKVFTYATPHGGIDLQLLGNVPGFFSMNDVNNFNQGRMREYLALPDSKDVNDLNGKFDPRRLFCLVGTNYKDYQVASGWSRRLVGPMSDGLVRIVNASVKDSEEDAQSPRAFVHRCHSGQVGIVNSEDGYQNLTRFFFGDVRVDGKLLVDELTLPAEVEKVWKAGSRVRASYHFEVVVRVRGYDWDLHRRTVAEESAIFRTFDEMMPTTGPRRSPHLFSTFLTAEARINKRRPSLAFSIDLGVLVPDYEVDGFLWRNQHFKGSYLFRDTITIEATPEGEGDNQSYRLNYGFDSKTPNKATKRADGTSIPGGMEFRIPLKSGTRPGLAGVLLLTARGWS